MLDNSSAIINLQVLTRVCKELGLPFEIKDDFGNFIEIKKGNKSFYFVYCNTPFNNESSSFISRDKEFSYRIFGKDLNMPKTKAYLNPEANDQYDIYKKYKNQNQIIEDIEENFSYPMIVKMNSGSRGNNTFLCHNENEIKIALRNIFNPNSKDYDYVANVQEYINIKKEYRVIWFEKKIVFVYEKVVNGQKKNISPLHNDDAKAILIREEGILTEIENFLSKSKSLSDFDYLGIDLVIDADGQMKLLEINSHPGFSYFVRDNGEEEIKKMYKKMLEIL